MSAQKMTTGAILGCFVSCLLLAQSTTPNRYETRAIHSRDGIGKFYFGREIAHVMGLGDQGVEWLERPERDKEEGTRLLLQALKFAPGENVADVGAGSGYYTRRIAPLVSPGGKVYAEDIQPEMLELTNSLAKLGITNVVPVIGTITDPKLPSETIDTILLVDVYHEFDHPFEMVEAMCRSLKRGGRIVFVEFRGEDPAVPIKPLHKMTEAQVKKEMAPHPLKWAETISVLPRQHIIVFKKT